MAGVSLAGGLLKQTAPQGIEYLGMLLGRFARLRPHRSSAATAKAIDAQDRSSPPSSPSARSTGRSAGRRRSSSPASAAASASTGSSSCRPTSSKFGDYPLIQALDIAAKPRRPDGRSCAQLGQLLPDEARERSGSPPASRSTASRSSTASRWSACRSATGSTSTCSASRAWRCRGRRWRWCRSRSRCWCASPAAKACSGCRASSPTTRGCSIPTSSSPAASRT